MPLSMLNAGNLVEVMWSQMKMLLTSVPGCPRRETGFSHGEVQALEEVRGLLGLQMHLPWQCCLLVFVFAIVARFSTLANKTASTLWAAFTESLKTQSDSNIYADVHRTNGNNPKNNLIGQDWVVFPATECLATAMDRLPGSVQGWSSDFTAQIQDFTINQKPTKQSQKPTHNVLLSQLWEDDFQTPWYLSSKATQHCSPTLQGHLFFMVFRFPTHLDSTAEDYQGLLMRSHSAGP